MNQAYIPLITKIMYTKMYGELESTRDFDLWALNPFRVLNSAEYNYLFDTETGEFWRWGATLEEDPQFSPFGPEIADIEISFGDCSAGCPWCYKSNTRGNGYHMPLETFEAILDKMPSVMQVALGLTDLDSHPQLLDILKACRKRGVVPNFTTAGFGVSLEYLEEIVPLVGAIAVSVYPHNMQTAYDTIHMLTNLGLEQTNIHLLYHQDNLPHVYRVLEDIKSDWRLKDLNAVVLLGLKPKGRGSNMKPLRQEEFTDLVEYCLMNRLPIGFDSCSCSKFLAAVNDLNVPEPTKAQFHMLAEPCESGLFSAYISADAKFYPCSFTEEVENAIDMTQVEDFLKDVWFSDKVKDWRKRLLDNRRRCPAYNID